MQFYVMRQFTRVHVAKCHSTISWVMSSFFPMTGFKVTECASTGDNRHNCAPTRWAPLDVLIVSHVSTLPNVWCCSNSIWKTVQLSSRWPTFRWSSDHTTRCTASCIAGSDTRNWRPAGISHLTVTFLFIHCLPIRCHSFVRHESPPVRQWHAINN